MTATLWIHRIDAADILVRFPNAHDAHQVGLRFLFKYQDLNEKNNMTLPWNEALYNEQGMLNVGDTPSLQVSVHPNDFHSCGYLGINRWTDAGTVLVSPEVAMDLGNTGIPVGFVSGEDPEGLWENPSSTLEEDDFETHYNRLDSEYADAAGEADAGEEACKYDEAVKEAKAHRLATSAFGYNERLDAPIDWSRWVKPARKNSDDDL